MLLCNYLINRYIVSRISSCFPLLSSFWCTVLENLLLVFWIRSILIRIRIWGSVPLDCGSGSYCFHRRLSRCQKMSFLKVFLAYFLEVFKEKLWKTPKTVDIKVFLNLFCLLMEGPEAEPYKWLWIRIWEVQKLWIRIRTQVAIGVFVRSSVAKPNS